MIARKENLWVWKGMRERELAGHKTDVWELIFVMLKTIALCKRKRKRILTESVQEKRKTKNKCCQIEIERGRYNDVEFGSRWMKNDEVERDVDLDWLTNAERQDDEGLRFEL